MRSGSVGVDIQRKSEASIEPFHDLLAVEEPLEIRLEYDHPLIKYQREQKSISITMRTPGNDFELAAGFLFTEGLVFERKDILDIGHCGPKIEGLGHSNVVKVKLAEGFKVDIKNLERHFYTSSSCGVCGKASIDALKTQNQFTKSQLGRSLSHFQSEAIYSLPQKLRESQEVFDRTGGLHASGLFDKNLELILVHEDVGRHNALDKIIGEAFLNQYLPLNNHLLLLSGRVSFELVQKAAMAGIQVIAAVGAPSSLAFELAKEMKITLIGFLRDRKFNIYTGASRII